MHLSCLLLHVKIHQKYFKFNTYTQQTSLTQGYWWKALISVTTDNTCQYSRIFYSPIQQLLVTTKYRRFLKSHSVFLKNATARCPRFPIITNYNHTWSINDNYGQKRLQICLEISSFKLWSVAVCEPHYLNACCYSSGFWINISVYVNFQNKYHIAQDEVE
jgi:hypothetical protein